VHVDQAVRLARRRHEALVDRPDVPAEQGRRQHGAFLHAQILRVAHHRGAQVQVSFDEAQIERLDHVNQAVEPHVAIGHIQQQILIAAQIAKTLKGVTMLQTGAAILPRLCDFQGLTALRRPVDLAHGIGARRVRRDQTGQVGPVSQWMLCHGAGDAVVGRLPDTAPGIGIRQTGPLPRRRFGYRGRTGNKIGE
jgi:hypothetical protein